MTDLTERRSRFVYEAARLAAIAADAPIIPESWDEREDDFKAQFRDVIDRQCGADRCTSAEQLHEEWVEAYRKMGWVCGPVRNREARTHPDMVPYAALGQLERDKDDVFVALCEIARLYIYDIENARMAQEPGSNAPEAGTSGGGTADREAAGTAPEPPEEGSGVKDFSGHTKGPWTVAQHGFIIYALDNQMHVADVRGWGYLTGKGHGAIGLPYDDAVAVQDANARLIAAAPDLLAENERLRAAEKAMAGGSILRPMSDAPQDETWIVGVLRDGMAEFGWPAVVMRTNDPTSPRPHGYWWPHEGRAYEDEEFVGWLPLPKEDGQ